MTDIKASSILKLSDSDLNQYKLHWLVGINMNIHWMFIWLTGING